MKRDYGFTLIEIMVVIGIIAIAGGIGAIGVSKYLPDYKLNSVVREYLSVLQEARLMSVKRHEHIAVSFSVAANSYEVFTDDGPTKGTLDPGEVLLKRGGNHKGVDMYAAAPAWIRFNPRGFPTSGVGDCLLKNNINTYRGVRVSMAGDARVIKSGDSGVTWY